MRSRLYDAVPNLKQISSQLNQCIMKQDVTEHLDLELAWRRIEADEKAGIMFVVPSFLSDLIRIDLEGWLERLKVEIVEGTYSPKDVRISDVPKPKYATRPGA